MQIINRNIPFIVHAGTNAGAGRQWFGARAGLRLG